MNVSSYVGSINSPRERAPDGSRDGPNWPMVVSVQDAVDFKMRFRQGLRSLIVAIIAVVPWMTYLYS